MTRRHNIFARLLVGLTAVAMALGVARTPAHAQTGSSLILPYVLIVYCDGGWDQTLVFDNKIGLDGVAQETGWSASTGQGDIPFVDHASRPSVKAFFNEWGLAATIVNGMYTRGLGHDHARRYMLGNPVPNTDNRSEDWLSYYAAFASSSTSLGHVVIDAPFMPGPHAPFAVKLDTALIADYEATTTGTLSTTAEAALQTYVQGSFAAAFTGRSSVGVDITRLRTVYAAQQREALIKSRIQSIASTLSTQTPGTTFVRNGKIAIELFRQGLANGATLRIGHAGKWDTHTANFATQSANFEELFAGLRTILAYASNVGVAGNLTLVVMSELGRRPHLNADGGKDHWPYTSALLWGAGIKGSTVVGLTDARLRGIPIDPLFGSANGPNVTTINMSNLWSALLLRFGVTSLNLIPDTVQPLTSVLSSTQ